MHTKFQKEKHVIVHWTHPYLITSKVGTVLNQENKERGWKRSWLRTEREWNRSILRTQRGDGIVLDSEQNGDGTILD